MSAGLFGIATSGLNAAQRALDTTGHNIANVNTEGYSRQRAEQVTRPAQFSGAGYIGKGVEPSTIRRMYDEFVQTQLRTTTTANELYKTSLEFISRVDNLLADPDAGLAPGLNKFFASIEELANDPTSTADRTVMISEAESMVDRFRFLDQRLKDQQAIVDGQMRTAVEEINSYSDSIARLNQQIVAAQGRGQPPNDLMDQRDQMVLELSKFVDVRTVEQDDGSLNVFVGRGQGLVVSNKATSLQASASSPGMPLDIRFGDNQVDISRYLSGGRLGSLLDVRGSVLDVAQNEIGRVAVAMAVGFNNQHQAGLDLNGDPGGEFFNVPRPEVLAGRGTDTPKPIVQYDPENLDQLTANDYRLTWTGSNWNLTQQPGGALVGSGASGDDLHVHGLQVTLPAGGNSGDSYLIRPTRQAAQELAVNIKEPDKLAAAAAMEPSLPDGVSLTSLSVTNAGDYKAWLESDPPEEMTFNQFTAMAGGLWKATSDQGVQIIVRSAGAPDADNVSVTANTDPGPGDNRNALALTQLQTTNILDNGNTSIEAAYNGLVGKVGTRTREAQVASEAQQRLLADARAQRESISGVNLDEEAANLLRYQQAYQAAAQSIAVTSTIFDTLIGVVGR